MMLSDLISNAKSHFAKRSRYNRIVSEIQALSQRDLADMGADRGDMLRQAYRDTFGR